MNYEKQHGSKGGKEARKLGREAKVEKETEI